ncbi:DUF397 domain-containing protein [Flindersiella endophytica]
MTSVISDFLWRKSSFSSGGNGNCVEVGVGSAIGVRDTKDRDGGTLVFATSDWNGFVGAVKDGTIRR